MHEAATAVESARELWKELGLRDLIFAQVLCVVGSAWVGVAAKLGNAHTLFWLIAMLLYYLPLAAVVVYLNREMPLEADCTNGPGTASGSSSAFSQDGIFGRMESSASQPFFSWFRPNWLILSALREHGFSGVDWQPRA